MALVGFGAVLLGILLVLVGVGLREFGLSS
jgi:hypothetical protein